VAHRILWVVAATLAALALVAGCATVNVPKGPYVVLGSEPPPPTPQDQDRVRAMDKPALEQEVLRLGAENDYLRQQVEKLRRDNKSVKDDKKKLEDRIDDLQKQIKDLKKR
jgi:peptidoglycan hydrolase CwlO-like protein